jgi:hypothetical protein
MLPLFGLEQNLVKVSDLFFWFDAMIVAYLAFLAP